MILSSKHRFVFVKGVKVAGTSVEIMLSEICGPEDIITPLVPIDERQRLINGTTYAQNYGDSTETINAYLTQVKNTKDQEIALLKRPDTKYYNHMPLSEIIQLYDIPEHWTVFAVDRCPYRKIISYANFRLKIKEYNRTGKAMLSCMSSLKNCIDKIIDDGSALTVKNIENYKNSAGQLKAEILRFEFLSEDLEKMMSKLSIDSYPRLGHYKKGIGANDLSLTDIFSNCQIKKINELFDEEFECFGYEKILV